MTLLLLQITFGSVASRERGAQASSRRMLRLVLGVDGVVVVASFREGLEASGMRASLAMIIPRTAHEHGEDEEHTVRATACGPLLRLPSLLPPLLHVHILM